VRHHLSDENLQLGLHCDMSALSFRLSVLQQQHELSEL